MEPGLLFLMQTPQIEVTGQGPAKKYNPYADDLAVDRRNLKKIVEDLVGLEEISVSQEVDIVEDKNKERRSV